MRNTQAKALGRQFVEAGLKLKAGEKLVVGFDSAGGRKIARAIMESAATKGALVQPLDLTSKTLRQLFNHAAVNDVSQWGNELKSIAMQADAVINILDLDRPSKNPRDKEEVTLAKTMGRMAMGMILKNTGRWTLTTAPTPLMAKRYNVNKKTLDENFIKACLLDYSHAEAAAKPLQELLKKTKDVRVIGKNTDLSFSLEGIGAVNIAGVYNMPDGEVFSAPVKDSVNGTISFGPSRYEGKRFSEVHLSVEKGKIVKARAGNRRETANLNKILDRDPGSRYFGEFALAYNPFISTPIGNTLLDEKIYGSLHLAVGNSYAKIDENNDPDNGNRSGVHWDLVHIQRPEFGGGEIWMDDRLVRKDGVFLVPELEALNPENLKKHVYGGKPGL